MKKILSLLVITTLLISAIPVTGFSAENDTEGIWQTVTSYNMDGFTKTSTSPAIGGAATFKSNMVIDGTTVNLNVEGGGGSLNESIWYPGNYCNFVNSANYANGAPEIMGDKVLFADLGWTKWPGNLVHPDSGPSITPFMVSDDVRVGDRIRITAWVYPTEVYSGWNAESTKLADQTTPFNLKMWTKRPWKNNYDVGYNNDADRPEMTVHKQARANEWTELVLEYDVTKTNSTATYLNISVKQDDNSKPYPRELYLAGVKVERLVKAKGYYHIRHNADAVTGKVDFALSKAKNPEAPKILVAAYENNHMLGVDVIDYVDSKSSYDFTITNASTADCVKAFIWDYAKISPLTPEAVTLEHIPTYSVLGDSYSTFEGYLHPETNYTYYPKWDVDVKLVEQTWWHLFEEAYGVALDVNNSSSGSKVCYGSSNIDKETSFVSRVTDLGDPDIIIIEGGTNDYWAGDLLGEFKYSNFTETDFETFRPALAYVLKTAKETYPKSRIIFMLNTGFSTEYNDSVRTICDYYDVELLELYDINKQSGHPSVAGMIQINNQLMALINK